MSKRGLRIVVLSRTPQKINWGIGQDARIVEQVLKEAAISLSCRIESIDHIDNMSFYGGSRKPRPVDIQIHLEIPCRAAWKWATMNIVIVNQEWWTKSAWDWVFKEKNTYMLFKSEYARSLFPEMDPKYTRVIQWRTSPERQTGLSTLSPVAEQRKRECLYLIGASENKLRAAITVCKGWKSTFPTLHIVGVEGVLSVLRPFAQPNIRFLPPFPNDSDRIAFQTEFEYHVVTSSAEGFGYTMHEAVALGAIPLWNALPVYTEYIGDILGTVGMVPSSSSGAESPYRDTYHSFRPEDVQTGMESLLALSEEDSVRLRGRLRHISTLRVKEFRQNWKALLGSVIGKLRKHTAEYTLPPKPLAIADVPHVAVLTITRNRPKWFTNMARNILLSDYPTDKLTWIVADDGDGSKGGRIDEQIMKFQSVNTHVRVKYLSLAKTYAVGAKRNLTCESAPPEATVFLIMDDDDHYPAGSIARRVAWLQSTGSECVYCSTLPMYDCGKYISAMNVPPLNLSPAERVSEATLTFTRKFWESGKFPNNVSVAEGEGFLCGREEKTTEIPPEGIIVSFLHGANATSRRIPEQTDQNGCPYGFDDDYFTYISGLALPTT